MTRTIFPMAVADLSAFAKSLNQQLGRIDHKPGHVEMLNLICKAAGYRNYQHFRAAFAPAPVDTVTQAGLAPAPNLQRVVKVARYFDDAGRLLRWPSRRALQELCLWALWSRLPARQMFTEREISDLLTQWHTFGDYALLRRALYDFRLVQRSMGGRDYKRIEQKPPVELKMLLDRIGKVEQKAA
jgi:hypothetical protein